MMDTDVSIKNHPKKSIMNCSTYLNNGFKNAVNHDVFNNCVLTDIVCCLKQAQKERLKERLSCVERETERETFLCGKRDCRQSMLLPY